MNLRDLGGWTGRDGRPVAYGRLYRSDRLSDLTDADLAVLARLGIQTVIDLRHEGETAEHPSRLWASVVLHRNIPMAAELGDPAGLDGERFRPALSAPEPALAAAIPWLRQSHGSVEAYLEGAAGVPDAGRRLRERLLNP